MAQFRNILADGDLIRERKLPCWWLFGKEKWQPWRNLSREVRYLEDRMHEAHAAYMAAREDYVVAHKNVSLDMDFLRMYKMDNSETSYEIPSDESILSRRDGVKYSNGNNSGKNQNGQNGKGNNQQSGSENSHNNENNQNQNNKQNQKQKATAKSFLELLAGAKVIIPT